MKVVWSVTATRQLENIHAYVELNSPAYARRVVDQIVLAADMLGDFPEMGRVVPEIDRPGVREVIHRPYRIIYRIFEHHVEVIAVVHGAQGKLPEIG